MTEKLPAATVGYAMVPVEPSEKMLDILYHNGPGLSDHLLLAIWAELLAAAPKAEPQPSDDAKDAARYRWLVKHSTYGIDYRQRPALTLPIYAPDHRDSLSAAIDAAMAGGGK